MIIKPMMTSTYIELPITLLRKLIVCRSASGIDGKRR
jgi:hypothetical protein